MDEQTLQMLFELGWREVLGRNDQGSYIAFVRGSDFFHVVLDSKRHIIDTKVEYAPNQFAKIVHTKEYPSETRYRTSFSESGNLGLRQV